MAGDNVLSLTDTNFEDEVLNADVPVLVDFTAVWCGPCRAIAPVVDKLADTYAGRVRVGKMDIDHNPKTPAKYHVRAVPTLVMFKGGKVLSQVVGAVNQRKLVSMVDGALN